MATSGTSRHTRQWLVVAGLVCVAIAVGLLFFLMSGKPPTVTPPQNPVADRTNQPDDVPTNRATPTETPEFETTEPNEERKPDQEQQPETPDADIILHLRLPEKWPEAVPCRLLVAPANSGATGGGRPIEIAPGEGLKVPVNVAVDSMVQVHGKNVLDFVAGVVRAEDGERFRVWSASSKSRRPVDRDEEMPHSTVLRTTVIDRGGTLQIEVLPLVTVRAVVRDGGGNPFLTGPIGWNIQWSVGRTDSRSGISGDLVSDMVNILPHDETASAIWLAPAGASLVVSASFQLGGLTPDPEKYRGMVPLDRDTHIVQFKFSNTAIGKIRVLSLEGEPLSTASVRPERRLPDEVWPSVMLEQSPTRPDVGVYAVMLTDTPHRIAVGAPQFVHEMVNSEDVPTDGSALDVTLQRGQPLLVVRVDFDDDGDLEKRFPVRLEIRTSSRENPDLQPFWWMGVIDLPPDGITIILGQPPGLPRVKPVSEHYEFELIERGHEGGLPLRRFRARPVTGVRIYLVDTEEVKWRSDQPANMIIARPIPPQDVGISGGATPADSPLGYVSTAKPAVIDWLPPGRWVIHVWQVEQGLVGEAEVMLDVGLKDVEVTPTDVGNEWVELKINDLTGECNAAGTTFFPGHAPLASMERSRENAVRMAKWLVEDKYPDSTPETGKLSYLGTLSLAAHHDRKLMAPSWLPDRLLVMPKDGLAVYEGVVDWEARTVTVQRPSWACSVAFTADNDSSDDSIDVREAGWFVAIREYRDEKDPVTVKGVDTKVKVTASGGTASIDPLPPGKYVAYYVRAGQHEEKDPDTGETTIRTRLEWCDAATFELQPGHTQVTLPTTRSR